MEKAFRKIAMFIMITFFVVCRYTQEGFDVK